MRRNKYGAKKVTEDGITFDSEENRHDMIVTCEDQLQFQATDSGNSRLFEGSGLRDFHLVSLARSGYSSATAVAPKNARLSMSGGATQKVVDAVELRSLLGGSFLMASRHIEASIRPTVAAHGSAEFLGI